MIAKTVGLRMSFTDKLADIPGPENRIESSQPGAESPRRIVARITNVAIIEDSCASLNLTIMALRHPG
jgi:hypothetical protein